MWPPRRVEAAGSTVAAAARTALDLEELGHEEVVGEARCRGSNRRGSRRGRGREEADAAVAVAVVEAGSPVLGRSKSKNVMRVVHLYYYSVDIIKGSLLPPCLIGKGSCLQKQGFYYQMCLHD